MRFSGRNAGDARIALLRGACESVEQVLLDLGLGFALRAAQEEQRRKLQLKRSGYRSGAVLDGDACDIHRAARSWATGYPAIC